MRRFIPIFLAFLFLFLSGVAYAWSDHTLPESISTFFEHGFTVLDQADLTGHGEDNCWFILVRNASNDVVLYHFKKINGKWKETLHTSKAIPQTEHGLFLQLEQSGEIWPLDMAFDLPHLSVSQLDKEKEYTELSITFELKKGRWLLCRVWSYTDYDSMLIRENAITYYENVESTHAVGTVRGEFQRDLQYFKLSALPKTLKEAKKKITEAPEIPDSVELIPQNIKFTGGKNYAVYSAPDETSLRGANGKAKVSTNSWIQVFGQDGEWIMIQYSIDSNHYRFGYIKASSLPKKTTVSQLSFSRTDAYTIHSAPVTDDPLYSQTVLATLPAGCSITLLAYMGDWAYIEYSGDRQTAGFRGFIPLSNLTLLTNPHTFDGLDYRTENYHFTIAPDNVLTADEAWQISASVIMDKYGVRQKNIGQYLVHFGYVDDPADFGGVPYWQFDFTDPEGPLNSYEIILSAEGGGILYTCGPGEGNG